MLGVLPEYRNAGVGRMLKLEQRDDALARGIELVEWTFDPLEFKNAYFNMERLGAVVRRYVPNQYGTTSSHLHGGLPTDRCVAEWYVDARARASDRSPALPTARPTVEAASPCRRTSPNSRPRRSEARRARSRRRISRAVSRALRPADSLSSDSSARPRRGIYLLGTYGESR